MSPREKIRAAAATAKAEKRNRLTKDCTTKRTKVQINYYTPSPGLIAYVAYTGITGKYEIIVSPIAYNDRGIWFEDRLPGMYRSRRAAQEALDYLADAEGWRFCTMPA